MAEEDNGTQPEPEQPQPRQGEAMAVGMQITTQGAVLSFPVQLGLSNEAMKQLVRSYLQAHPEEVQEIAKEAIAQKQQELAFIQMIKRSRND